MTKDVEDIVKSEDVVSQLIRDWNRTRPELDPSAMGVVGRVLILAKHFEDAANEVLAEHGLAVWSLDVLATLRRVGPPYTLTPTQLRNSVLLSSGAMTNRLDRLEEEGLLMRTPSREDRRSVKISLTEKGRRLIDEAIVSRFQIAKENVECLTEEELEELGGLLRRLLVANGQAKEAQRQALD